MTEWDALLNDAGVKHYRLHYAGPPASAQAAADLAGVAVEQVVKAVSVLVDGERAVCLVPGDVRFSSSALAAAVGGKVEQAEVDGEMSGPLPGWWVIQMGDDLL